MAGTGITKGQIKKLQTMRRRLGLTEDDYRLMLWNVAGVKSCRELKGGKVQAVLEHLGRCLGEGSSQQSAVSNQPGSAMLRATAAQARLIEELWGRVTQIPYTQPRERRQALRAWLKRTVKASHEHFLTRDMAQRAIEGLKRMAERREREAVPETPGAASAGPDDAGGSGRPDH
jgi:hypothetical protein